MRVVLDTNIIVGAMLSGGGAAREILRLSLENCITSLIGVALFSEMQDVLSRGSLFQKCLLDAAERDERLRFKQRYTDIRVIPISSAI